MAVGGSHLPEQWQRFPGSCPAVCEQHPNLCLFPLPADTMVCTGCCSCLDHIVTYLFKQLSRSTKKRTTPLSQESDRFLHIMQQHPEMIQQVRMALSPP